MLFVALYRVILLMSEVSKSGVCGFIQSNLTHVRGVESA